MSLSKSLYPRSPTPVTEIRQHPAYQARHAHTHTLEPSDRTMFFALMDFASRVYDNPQRYANGIGWSDFMREFDSITAATDVFAELERMHVYRLVSHPSRLEPVREIDPTNEARFRCRPVSVSLPDGLVDAAKKRAAELRMSFSSLVAQALVVHCELLSDDQDLINQIMETY